MGESLLESFKNYYIGCILNFASMAPSQVVMPSEVLDSFDIIKVEKAQAIFNEDKEEQSIENILYPVRLGSSR